jgi:hypothetical protein
MDRQSAELIVPILVRAAQEMVDTIEVARAHSSEDEVERYSDRVKQVIFAIDDVLRPIIVEYPELHP